MLIFNVVNVRRVIRLPFETSAQEREHTHDLVATRDLSLTATALALTATNSASEVPMDDIPARARGCAGGAQLIQA